MNLSKSLLRFFATFFYFLSSFFSFVFFFSCLKTKFVSLHGSRFSFPWKKCIEYRMHEGKCICLHRWRPLAESGLKRELKIIPKFQHRMAYTYTRLFHEIINFAPFNYAPMHVDLFYYTKKKSNKFSYLALQNSLHYNDAFSFNSLLSSSTSQSSKKKHFGLLCH